MRLLARLFLVVLLLAGQLALAADVQLYARRGEQVTDYQERLSELVPGDRLVFTNGRSFTFDGFVGHGNTTQLVSVDGGRRVLRLPINSGLFKPENHEPLAYTDYLWSYLEGWDVLRRSDVPVVKLFPEESDPSEYLVAEKLDLKFTLAQLFEGWLENDPEGVKARAQLEEFARQTWQFSSIGDFRAEQVGWTGHRWVLFDFTNELTPYQHNPAHSVWEKIWDVPKSIQEKLSRIIFDKRSSADPHYCESLLTAKAVPVSNDPFKSL